MSTSCHHLDHNCEWPDTDELVAAANRIRPYVSVTPVMTSSLLDSMSNGRRLYFKCEHLQRTGSFKLRGALNALLRMPQGYAGVVAHSSGNHGQALAWAADRLRLVCCVVVPNDTPAAKIQPMRSYGAEVHFCQPNYSDRRRVCDRLAAERRLYPVPSSDHWDVISGQASVGLELIEQVPELDAVLVPVCGGGLAAGVALASATMSKAAEPASASAARSSVRVYCVEAAGKNLAASLVAGQPLNTSDEFIPTVAESLRLRPVAPLALSVLHRLAERRVFSVDNAGMAGGVRLAARYLKQTVEAASGAALFAAVHLADKTLPPVTECQNIGVVLSGGNLDPFSKEFTRLTAELETVTDGGGGPVNIVGPVMLQM
ncbi:hypothetical protein BOX15_Mlig033490g2 [Macrostomum lignano]|uniref:Serine racemase n=1 Tax=Macrostomum lignano TaxID=282301 RepID=A0A267DXS8_9PLAT|nr:hypothetical protein BOX15_Mlig033490g2 [Macrostomum lignano]